LFLPLKAGGIKGRWPAIGDDLELSLPPVNAFPETGEAALEMGGVMR
jgi:hypothetical protein